MTQRKLFVGALVLTLAIGSLLIVAGQQSSADPNNSFKPGNCATPKYFRNHRKPCQAVSPVATVPGTTNSPVGTSTPGQTSPSPATSPTSNPTTSPIAAGQVITLIQAPGVNIAYPKPLPAASANSVRLDQLKEAPKAWISYFDKQFPNIENEKKVLWHRYLLIKRGSASFEESAFTTPLTGLKDDTKTTIETNYFISDLLATTADQTTQWLSLQMRYKATNEQKLRLAYRVTDGDRTTDPKASDWVEVPLTYHRTKTQTIKAPINQVGRYLQYKVNIAGLATRADNIGIVAQPVQAPQPSPSPTSTSSASPSPGPNPSTTPSTSPVAGEGKLTIMTKMIVVDQSLPTATPSGGPVLPSSNPSPSPSSSLVATPPPDQPNPNCDNQSTDSAANVPLSLKMIDTTQPNPINITNQQTDADGRWQGLDGAIDSFPGGTYEISFGEFQKTDYKLVAFCDPQTRHLLPSRSSPANRKATLVIRAGQTSQLIALYALRTNPYIAMNKFAVPLSPGPDGKLKVLRIIFPGLRFNYLIKYQNTGGERAKEVVIRDVIPAELEVQETSDDSLQLQPDSRGGTLVTKAIGELAAGQQGSITIPVRLKPDAFTGTGVLAP